MTDSLNNENSARSIKPPVFAKADDDPAVLPFKTAQEAEAYIEVPDYEGWKVYDAAGRVLNLQLSPDKRSVSLLATDEMKPDELASLLRDYLCSVQHSELMDAAPLEKLVAEVWQHEYAFRLKQARFEKRWRPWIGLFAFAIGILLFYYGWINNWGLATGFGVLFAVIGITWL